MPYSSRYANRGYRSFAGSVRLARMKVLVGVDGSSNSLATAAFVGGCCRRP